MRIDRIKLLVELAQRDINQKDFADQVGIARGTLSAVCRGVSCSDRTAEKIAQGLGVPLEELLEKPTA